MNGTVDVEDGAVEGADEVVRIVSELIGEFRSVGRPLSFYEVEVKLHVLLEKLRLLVEMLAKEKGLLRQRVEGLGVEKVARDMEVRKLRDCIELSGVFTRMRWSGGADRTERSAEEIYEAMMSEFKVLRDVGEDLSEVDDHLRRKVDELEKDLRDVGILKMKLERVEAENAEMKRRGDRDLLEAGELRRRVSQLEAEKAEMKRKVEDGTRSVGEMRRKMADLEMKNATLRGEVELRRENKELASENAKLKVEEKMAVANAKVKVEGDSWDLRELSKKVEHLESENKELKTKLGRNESLKREFDKSERLCKDLESEKYLLEEKNELLQSNFDKVTRENEKLGKKISSWKKNYEVMDKKLIVLEKQVEELKSCDEGVLWPKDRKVCCAEDDAGNGKHVEIIENRRSDDVHSAAPPTGDQHPVINLAKEPPPSSSTKDLKRKKSDDKFIDLTQDEDDDGMKKEADLCRSSSWMTSKKRVDLGIRGEKLDGSSRSTNSLSTTSSSTLLH